jgi:hypothetical protein
MLVKMSATDPSPAAMQDRVITLILIHSSDPGSPHVCDAQDVFPPLKPCTVRQPIVIPAAVVAVTPLVCVTL